MQFGLIEGRPVAQLGRAPVSKTGCWGFESLLACQVGVGSGRKQQESHGKNR